MAVCVQKAEWADMVFAQVVQVHGTATTGTDFVELTENLHA
jgi:hypothetical protein